MVEASQFTDFWTWFQANEADFPSSVTDIYAAYGDELTRRVAEISPRLVCEIAVREDRENELVISANGDKELIPFVQAFVDSAPPIDGWKIVAFRPREESYATFTLNIGERDPGELVLEAEDLWCWSRVRDDKFYLIILHPDFSDENRELLKSGTFILLDAALGEYDVMTGLHAIDHQKLPDDPESAGLYPFKEVRAVFDEYKSIVTVKGLLTDVTERLTSPVKADSDE